MAFARSKGVNLSALGIGVDFLQIVSIFTYVAGVYRTAWLC